MSKKDKLSVVVSVFNGEKVLDGCLESASFASEIIVINNTSTDETLKIAKKHTDKIFTKSNNLMLNINKNFGFSKATGEWIFCLDADERISPELAEELKFQVKNVQEDVNGFWIPRKNIIFGKWIEYAGWYPDYQLRLFRKGKGKFPEEHVHEAIKINGKVEYLRNAIVHNNYESITQFLSKLTYIYGPNEAEQLIKNGYVFNWRDSIRFPVKEFLSRYFAREGYKDGFHGLMLSVLMGFYHFIVFSYIWEKQKFKQINDKAMLVETEKEIIKSSKDIFYWFSREKTKLTKNPLLKIIRRIKIKART